MTREQRLERGYSLIVSPHRGVGTPQLPVRLAIPGPLAGFPAEFRYTPVVMPAVPVGDLQVGLCHLHPRVNLQRPGKLGDRFFYQTFLIVEDAEVVVGPGIGRVDSSGEGAEDR